MGDELRKTLGGAGDEVTSERLDESRETTLLERARAEDASAFGELAMRYRRELHVHCYRMMGSLHDAEDLVQETWLRAWRGIGRFESRTSFRRWLYRIATNACLNALEQRKRAGRLLPDLTGAPTGEMPDAFVPVEAAWLDPYPDAALDGIADEAPGPHARYELRESVSLAFLAAIQLLAPRQRAVLLLHDVLGWSAAESAQLIGVSVASVNSALQRARVSISRHGAAPGSRAKPDADQRALLERYARAWEAADVDGFVALLKDDVVFAMPPWPQWYRGREAIGRLFVWTGRPGGHGPFRLVPTSANRAPGFAFYNKRGGTTWSPHSIQVLEWDGGLVSRMVSFVDARLFDVFERNARATNE
jgi:RNA polymerase sigma-70 factor, ECF subfamily